MKKATRDNLFFVFGMLSLLCAFSLRKAVKAPLPAEAFESVLADATHRFHEISGITVSRTRLGGNIEIPDQFRDLASVKASVSVSPPIFSVFNIRGNGKILEAMLFKGIEKRNQTTAMVKIPGEVELLGDMPKYRMESAAEYDIKLKSLNFSDFRLFCEEFSQFMHAINPEYPRYSFPLRWTWLQLRYNYAIFIFLLSVSIMIFCVGGLFASNFSERRAQNPRLKNEKPVANIAPVLKTVDKTARRNVVVSSKEKPESQRTTPSPQTSDSSVLSDEARLKYERKLERRAKRKSQPAESEQQTSNLGIPSKQENNGPAFPSIHADPVLFSEFYFKTRIVIGQIPPSTAEQQQQDPPVERFVFVLDPQREEVVQGFGTITDSVMDFDRPEAMATELTNLLPIEKVADLLGLLAESMEVGDRFLTESDVLPVVPKHEPKIAVQTITKVAQVGTSKAKAPTSKADKVYAEYEREVLVLTAKWKKEGKAIPGYIFNQLAVARNEETSKKERKARYESAIIQLGDTRQVWTP